MKRIVLGLNIFAAVLAISAISGVSSLWTNSNGVTISHYPNMALRLLAVVCGGGLYYVGWCIQNKRLLGWRLYFVIQTFAWIGFIVLGTNALADGYPTESNNDNLLFSGILALISLPVIVFWGRQWYRERKFFNN